MTSAPGPPGHEPDERLNRTLAAWAERPRRTVVFDFNGTLSDDEPILQRIFSEMAADLGWSLSPDGYFSELAGRSDREIIEIVRRGAGDAGQPSPEELLERRRARYREIVHDSCPVRSESIALVRLLQAHGIPMAIVTGAEREDVDLVLERAGLADAFAVTITAADVRAGKPDPEGFLGAAEALGTDPAAVLVLEDSVPGIVAARAAGMACVAVEGCTGRRELESLADAVVDRLSPDPFSVVLTGDAIRRGRGADRPVSAQRRA